MILRCKIYFYARLTRECVINRPKHPEQTVYSAFQVLFLYQSAR